MTKTDYALYCATVQRNTNHLTFVSTGACPGCAECGLGNEPSEGDVDRANEPHFSWRPCQVCDRSSGGNRYAGHAFKGDELVHFTVCSDCLYYLEYGRLDDTTMMEMEKGAQ